MIFETHAHYDDEAFSEDRDELIASLPSRGIGTVINVGATIESTRSSLVLSGAYDFVYAAVGVHPSETADLNEDSFAWLRAQTAYERTVAIGEIGLDYYWDKEPEIQERQRCWFRRQLELAKESRLPVIIHSRDAAEDTVELIKEAGIWDTSGERSADAGRNACGVIHCYSYSPELAKEFIRQGYYIGVGGVVTFKNARKLKETVQNIPLERILLETDCPYMAPEPYRGKRNDSAYLHYVVDKIAELRGITAEEVERVTWENAMQLFTRIKQQL